MALRSTEPDNKNFLSPIGFQFAVQKIPHVNYFCTAASIPDMSLGNFTMATPFTNMPEPGDKIEFGQLDLTFRIDEDLKNFQEIYNWMVSIGVPDNFNQRVGLRRPSFTEGDFMFSDGSLIITTNQYKPNVTVKFTDMFPVNLSALEFNVDTSDVEYLNGSVTFAYRKYDLTTVA